MTETHFREDGMIVVGDAGEVISRRDAFECERKERILPGVVVDPKYSPELTRAVEKRTKKANA